MTDPDRPHPGWIFASAALIVGLILGIASACLALIDHLAGGLPP